VIFTVSIRAAFKRNVSFRLALKRGFIVLIECCLVGQVYSNQLHYLALSFFKAPVVLSPH